MTTKENIQHSGDSDGGVAVGGDGGAAGGGGDSGGGSGGDGGYSKSHKQNLTIAGV